MAIELTFENFDQLAELLRVKTCFAELVLGQLVDMRIGYW